MLYEKNWKCDQRIKFEEDFNCLGENTEKYKTFSVPIEKEIRKIDENGEENLRTISYKIKFIECKIYDNPIMKSCRWSCWRNSKNLM